jgi:nucleoside-diphosphate-sugar epimerase
VQELKILLIGCGYVGLSLADKLLEAGHAVTGLRRSLDVAGELQGRGIQPLIADITRPESLDRIESAFDLVVNLVSSTRGSVEDYRAVYLEGTRNVLRWLGKRPPKKFIYTSSTSIYGQNDGSWVTEESSAAPANPTSQVLLETEQELIEAHRGSAFPAVVLRVGGIYGPGRGHLFKQYLRDEAAMRPEAHINMVHVDDVAGAIIHLSKNGQDGAIYNLVDDEPVTQQHFFEWLSQQLQKPMPPAVPPDPNRKRGVSNKRVSNAKLRATGYSFIHPTFREGYAGEIEISRKGST